MRRADAAFFPQDKRLDIQGGLYSRGLAQQMVWLSGLLPYERCVEVYRLRFCRKHRQIVQGPFSGSRYALDPLGVQRMLLIRAAVLDHSFDDR